MLQELQPNASDTVSRLKQKRHSSNKLVIVSDDEDDDDTNDDVNRENGKFCYTVAEHISSCTDSSVSSCVKMSSISQSLQLT